MRPITQRLTAAGFGAWLPLDQYTQGWVTALGVVLSSNHDLTYSVQHTFDSVLEPRIFQNLTRSTTTATLTLTNHGLSVDDYIGVRAAGGAFDGDFAVATVVDQNNITYTVANSGATVYTPGAKCLPCRVFNHLVLVGQTVNGDSSYNAPPAACRLNITTWVAGYADLIVRQGGLQ